MGRIDYSKAHFETAAVHAAQGRDPTWGAMQPPIYLSATFGFETIDDVIAVKAGKRPGYAYTRASNPTNDILEKKLAILSWGEAASVTASGIGAVGATLVSFLKHGDHVVCSDGVYGGTDYIMRNNLPDMGIDVTFVDATNASNIEAAITPATKMIYFETPMNPSMRLVDIEAVVAIGKAHGIKVVVDCTFAPPPIQYPLHLGVDLVVYSTTKYINGHGDALGGAVVGRKEDIAWIKTRGISKVCGTPQNPFASYLTLRGIQTLYLRLRQQSENAMAVARYLETLCPR